MAGKCYLIIIVLFIHSISYAQIYIPEDSTSRLKLYGGRGDVNMLEVLNDTLYVGGGFDTAGGVASLVIAQWAGGHFHSMAPGIMEGDMLRDAVLYHDTIVIVGISFNMAGDVSYTNEIAEWYHGNYYRIAKSVCCGSEIWSAEVYHDTIFFGGSLGIDTLPYPSPPELLLYLHNKFGYYHGKFFQIPGYVAYDLEDMAIYNDQLYATCSYYELYRFNSNLQEYEIVAYFDGYARNLTVDTVNNFLYISGVFSATVMDDTIKNKHSLIYNVPGVVRWNGFYYERLGTSYDLKDVLSTEVYKGDVYINGELDTLDGVYVRHLARWDGVQWHMVGPYPGVQPGGVLKVYHDTLYFGFDVYEGNPPTGYIGDSLVCGFARFFMPDDSVGCRWLMPRVFSDADTFYVPQGGSVVEVPLYNNNAYADSWLWDFDNGLTDTVKDPVQLFYPGVYDVSVTVTMNGCTKTASKTIVIEQATNQPQSLEFNGLAFKIYPNPTLENFTVEVNVPLEVQNKQFEVINLKGKGIFQQPLESGFNRFIVKTVNLDGGIYFCNIVFNQQVTASQKLVLTK